MFGGRAEDVPFECRGVITCEEGVPVHGDQPVRRREREAPHVEATGQPGNLDAASGRRIDLDQDVIKVAVVERHGKTPAGQRGIGVAFVKGFGLKRGAIAPWAGGQTAEYFTRLLQSLGETIGFWDGESPGPTTGVPESDTLEAWG